jgi:hypothetical protein
MTSDSIGELAKALAAAQGEMTSASKDATNPHFKSRYATLASVWDAIRGPLSRNGLSVSQVLETPDAGSGVIVRTMLLHSSGQWIASRYVMPIPDKLTPQAVGSAITYARRYALSAIVGIAPDDDDDGNGASGKDADVTKDKQPEPQKPATKPQDPPAKKTLHGPLLAFLDAFHWPDEHKKDFAARLVKPYETTIPELIADAGKAKAVLSGLEAEVKKLMDSDALLTDRADAMQVLFAKRMETT